MKLEKLQHKFKEKGPATRTLTAVEMTTSSQRLHDECLVKMRDVHAKLFDKYVTATEHKGAKKSKEDIAAGTARLYSPRKK